MTSEEILEGNAATPLRVKDMAYNGDEWEIIFNSVVHDNTVIVNSLFRPSYKIEADYFHSKIKNFEIRQNYAVNLVIRLLREGIKITFLDGSEREIAKVSPPIYDKYYRINDDNTQSK